MVGRRGSSEVNGRRGKLHVIAGLYRDGPRHRLGFSRLFRERYPRYKSPDSNRSGQVFCASTKPNPLSQRGLLLAISARVSQAKCGRSRWLLTRFARFVVSWFPRVWTTKTRTTRNGDHARCKCVSLNPVAYFRPYPNARSAPMCVAHTSAAGRTHAGPPPTNARPASARGHP